MHRAKQVKESQIQLNRDFLQPMEVRVLQSDQNFLRFIKCDKSQVTFKIYFETNSHFHGCKNSKGAFKRKG